MGLRLDSVPAHLRFPVPSCLPAGAEILPGKTKGRPVIQSGWLPGTTSVCFYFTNYRLNEWEKKTPCFVPRCSSFPLLSQSKKQSSRLCKAGANSSALARILTIVCFSLCTGTLSENLLWKSQSNMRRPSKFVLFFFSPSQILSVGSKPPVASLIIVIFPRFIRVPSCFGPYAQAVTVFFSDRLSGQRIVPRAPLEDGARWLVYSRWLHRGGSHSDLWCQGNTASSVQVRAQGGDSVRRAEGEAAAL